MNAIAERMEQPVTQLPAASNPMELLSRAIDSGASMEVLEKMMGLQERWEANNARKAFDQAMAQAKAEIPVIVKNRAVDFTSTKGRTNYRYEDLGEIARVVSPILARYGLSYRFRTTSPPNEPVTVTCIITHRDGHAEENMLTAGRDDSGNKNSIQAIGSTLTYLQRMTLKAALGIAASEDDDGKRADDAAPAEAITAEQATELWALIEKRSNPAGALEYFLRIFKIDAVESLLSTEFVRAKEVLSKPPRQGGK